LCHRQRRSRKNEAGFSLIEVLVAVTITVILLVPLIRNFTSSMNYGAAADASIEATLIAESMIETLSARLPLSPGESVADEGRFSVAASVRPYVGENGPPAGRYVVPYELAVSVSWQDGRRRHAVTLRTLRVAAASPQ
jgi:prepilin-type N-terminal cleavage/methylation domain-containing protein